jgi:hypothetical protein
MCSNFKRRCKARWRGWVFDGRLDRLGDRFRKPGWRISWTHSANEMTNDEALMTKEYPKISMPNWGFVIL